MKFTTSTGIWAAIVAMTAAVAAAQAPTPQNGNSSTDTKTVVTGCLKQAPSGATDAAARGGSAPTAGSASSDTRFVLENATTTSAAAEPSSKSGPQTYQLIANPTGLAPHAGKKLELTGTLEPSAAGGPTLRVESGKIVSASCAD
jgi:hypothetical protein